MTCLAGTVKVCIFWLVTKSSLRSQAGGRLFRCPLFNASAFSGFLVNVSTGLVRGCKPFCPGARFMGMTYASEDLVSGSSPSSSSDDSELSE